MDRERRLLETDNCELRVAEGGKSPHITGYAIRYNVKSRKMFFGREVIVPGAFKSSLKGDGDILATVDHENSKILGRRSAGTLTLKDDSKGLYVDIDAPNTTASRDVQESIKRGDVQGMSFEFRVMPNGDRWESEDGEDVRYVHNAELFQVGPVTDPAYLQTNAEVAMRSHAAWKKSQPVTTGDLRRRLDLLEA